MQTLYPIKIRTGNKFRYAIFLWVESWRKTDDFFYVMERGVFKPYYRNVTYAYQGDKWVEVYPEYHYKEEFKQLLRQFIDTLPIRPVVVQGKRLFYVYGFYDEGYEEHWAYDPINQQIYYAFHMPNNSLKPEDDMTYVKESLYHFMLKYVEERVKFAGIHLDHITIITRGQK